MAIDSKFAQIHEDSANKRSEADEFWSALHRRVPYPVFFTILGALMGITMGMMGVVYTQGRETLQSVISIDKNVVAISQKVESNTNDIRKLERLNRHSDNDPQTGP